MLSLHDNYDGMFSLLLSLAVAAPTSSAQTEPQASQCPVEPVPLPATLATWRDQPHTDTMLRLGQPVAFKLLATGEPDAGFGGSLALNVVRSGTYRVVLSDPAWIDVMSEGGALTSTGHGHGPPCSGIRKIVAFALHPGDYTVRISKSRVANVRIMVVAD